MSESVRDLVVTLSLNQGDFDRNLRSVAAAIRQAESEFRLAAAGTKSFDTSLTGLAAKQTEDFLKDVVDPILEANKGVTAGNVEINV